MTDQKNLVLAIAISVAILFGFHFIYEVPRQQRLQAEMARQKAMQEQTVDPATAGATAPVAAPGGVPAAPGAVPGASPQVAQAAPAEAPRVRIETPELHGSVSLRGGRFDDLTLARYKTEPKQGAPEVALLAPAGSSKPYFAEFGWIAGQDGAAQALPGPQTDWTARGDRLAPGQPLVLSWDNGQGLVFEREISVDENFMFTVVQRVRNTGGQPVTLFPYGRIVREGTPETSGFYILHEGPIGVANGTLQELTYDEAREDGSWSADSTGGWIGITDKYWLVTLIPDQKTPVAMRVSHQQGDVYQTDYRGQALTVQPGATAETTNRLFAGAKVVRLLDRYEDELGVARFSYAVDWGWFYFLTKPFFYALDWLGRATGNFGIAILVFTVFLRLAFFPLANKQYESFGKMKKLQPQMEELRKRCGDDRQRMSQEMMALYKREQVNPLAGCFPILLQIPVFFALYKVLFVTIEMRHAPFYGWIRDLSAPDPTTLFNLFGLIPWDPPSFLHIGVLPLAMGVTMWLQQKMSPAAGDPVQQRVMMMLPFLFTYMMAAFPAGLVLYWTWSNLLSIAQQWFIMRRMGVKNPAA
ncbi:MAG TPA: membrane protein insertase YidC [Azospirillaceae bacterium]|nr:membrane protein insertase YidC [Azospirillaceae bacterium]